MTIQRKFEIGGFIVALVLCAMFVRGWMAERDARNSADAFAKAQTAKADVLARQITVSQVQADDYRAIMAGESASVTTPQQAVKIITQYLPAPPAAPSTPGEAAAPAAEALPIPIVAANELDQLVRDQLPPAPSYAILTPDQTEAIAKNDLACDADRHSLAACTVQFADETKIAALNQSKADMYDQALKGGTWKQRVGRVLKYTGCAAGGAAIGALATRNSPTGTQLGSVSAGAAGGVIACSLF
jgi:hypothetical protein